jgi:DNA-binding transcriptional regulator YhcF (GntR family)
LRKENLSEKAKTLLGILDRILELLSVDDGLHSTTEIAHLTGLKPTQVEKAFKLLGSIEFIHFDGQNATIDTAIKQLILSDDE